MSFVIEKLKSAIQDSESVQLILSQGQRPVIVKSGKVEFLDEAFLSENAFVQTVDELKKLWDLPEGQKKSILHTKSDIRFELDLSDYEQGSVEIKGAKKPQSDAAIDQWPEYLLDWANLESGIVIIGSRDSKVGSRAKMQYFNKLNRTHNKVLNYFENQSKSFLLSQKSFVRAYEKDYFLSYQVNEKEVVFVDLEDKLDFIKVLECAKKGALVFCTSQGFDLTDLLYEFQNQYQDIEWKRFVRMLKGILFLSSIDKNLHLPVSLRLHDENRSEIFENSILNEESLVKELDFQTSSLEHVLLNQILKKKISMDGAFKLSSRPKLLDKMLEKTGF